MALNKLLAFCTLPGICSWVLRFKTFVCTYDRCSWTNCESLRWNVFLESTKITRLFRTSFKDCWLLKIINCFCLERKRFSKLTKLKKLVKLKKQRFPNSRELATLLERAGWKIFKWKWFRNVLFNHGYSLAVRLA